MWFHFRFAQWFAHHLSNWKFEWEWDKWSSVLQAAPEHPKVRFVKEVLAKCLRSVQAPSAVLSALKTYSAYIRTYLEMHSKIVDAQVCLTSCTWSQVS